MGRSTLPGGSSESHDTAGAGTGRRPVVVVCVPPSRRAEFFPGEVGDRLGTGVELVLVDTHEGLSNALPRADVLVTSRGIPRLGADLLDLAPGLRLVAHIGVPGLPFPAGELFGRGIRVTRAGHATAHPAAEVALGFTLALLHRIPPFGRAPRPGAERVEAGRGLCGLPVGVLGASRTARDYLKMLEALGARPLLHDPALTAADVPDLGTAEIVERDELLRRSRILTLQPPTVPETHRILRARELRLMPDGAGLVNTAWSWLVDEAALVAELRTGRIDAAIDVGDEEPPPTGHPLRALENVLLRPRQAAETVDRQRQGAMVLDEITRWLSGAPLLHEVTPGTPHPAGAPRADCAP